MTESTFFNEHQVTGALLILAFILFGIGASLPLLGEKGNSRIYNLPAREYLTAVANNANTWRWANVFMGEAGIILAAGLTMLTNTLERSGGRLLPRLALVGLIVAAIAWVIFSIFRATATIRAGQELLTTGTVPADYESMAKWGGALFFLYATLGFLALIAYGASLLQVSLLPAWSGWGTIIFSFAMLILLFTSGDTLPAFHYMPPLLIGILLIIGG